MKVLFSIFVYFGQHFFRFNPGESNQMQQMGKTLGPKIPEGAKETAEKPKA